VRNAATVPSTLKNRAAGLYTLHPAIVLAAMRQAPNGSEEDQL
jgi:hypothetical protein